MEVCTPLKEKSSRFKCCRVILKSFTHRAGNKQFNMFLKLPYSIFNFTLFFQLSQEIYDYKIGKKLLLKKLKIMKKSVDIY